MQVKLPERCVFDPDKGVEPCGVLSGELIEVIEAQTRNQHPISSECHMVFQAKGKSPLAQMMSLVLFGDYVSFYLALLNAVDPTPVAPIDYLKKRLSEL